ncbi:phage tail assembly protein [Rappaport israeli]|uniref:phage tail assembly protein n=1 Tax=Rappaport israeli TaxID=1839807 RepID=UPI000B02DE82|nr:phage tail assembly protein [Rappaport israeli]
MNKTITLNTPLKSGNKTISEFELREPKAGELRNIKLFDVMQMDSAAYIELLPRITTPTLTKAQVADMSLADLMQTMTAVAEWFAGKPSDTQEDIPQT